MVLWYYDSSRQLLIYADPIDPKESMAWKVTDLMKMGWNIFGLNSLPRWKK